MLAEAHEAIIFVRRVRNAALLGGTYPCTEEVLPYRRTLTVGWGVKGIESCPRCFRVAPTSLHVHIARIKYFSWGSDDKEPVILVATSDVFPAPRIT